jgi:hypothetical protein
VNPGIVDLVDQHAAAVALHEEIDARHAGAVDRGNAATASLEPLGLWADGGRNREARFSRYFVE